MATSHAPMVSLWLTMVSKPHITRQSTQLRAARLNTAQDKNTKISFLAVLPCLVVSTRVVGLYTAPRYMGHLSVPYTEPPAGGSGQPDQPQSASWPGPAGRPSSRKVPGRHNESFPPEVVSAFSQRVAARHIPLIIG